jgi:hypothetical protein
LIPELAPRAGLDASSLSVTHNPNAPSFLQAVANGVALPGSDGRANKILARVDRGVCVQRSGGSPAGARHRATFVSESYYGPGKCF